MTNKHMLKLAPLLLTMAGLATARPTAAEDTYLETIKVSENVYVFKPKIDWSHGNGVAIIAPEGVFFIDTYLQFNYAEEAIRRLKKVTKLPVKYVFNTHSHNDHTSGNGVFRRVYPESRLIVNEAAVVGLEGRVKAKVEGEKAFIDGELAQADTEVKLGKTRGGTPLVGSIKEYWELSLREAREYQQQYRPEKYVSPDIIFGDTLTMRWGSLTLEMIHMSDNGHSRADMIVWIPEQRILIAGDLVVAPTPYYSLPGITNAVRRLIAMNPAIIIPGHGPVEYDLSYMQLLERGFSTYQQAAAAAVAARIPERRALDSISFPDIDRAFTGGDEMKTWAYRRFFTDNVIHLTYQATSTPASAAPQAHGNARAFRLDSLSGLQLENVKADLVDYRGRRALHLLPQQGTVTAGWQGQTEAMAIVAGSDFKNGVIDVELAGAPMAGAREGSRGFVGLTFRTAPHASSFESFYLRPTNGRADDQLRRNHSAQYQAFPNYQWDRLRQDSPGVYESYVDIVPGQWTTMRIVVAGTKAQLFVNGATQPTLVVNDLKLGESSGPIGLWIGQDTEAYFSRLSVTPS